MTKGKELAVQLELFGSVSKQAKNFSNLIGLYSILPIYSLSHQRKIQVDDMKVLNVIEKKFIYLGHEYNLAILPARIKNKEGKYEEFVPGGREDTVENILIRMLSEGRGIEKDGKIRLYFTLGEVLAELKKVKRSIDRNEIKLAIQVLAHTNFTLTDPSGTQIFKPQNIILDYAFHEEQGKMYVTFNEYIVEAVKSKTWRPYNYIQYHSLSTVISRYLYKRMSLNYTHANSSNFFSILLSSIFRDGGLEKPKGDSSQSKRMLLKALNDLKKNNVVEKFNIEKKKTESGVDFKVDLWPAESFIKDMKISHSLKKQKGRREKKEGGNP